MTGSGKSGTVPRFGVVPLTAWAVCPHGVPYGRGGCGACERRAGEAAGKLIGAAGPDVAGAAAYLFACGELFADAAVEDVLREVPAEAGPGLAERDAATWPLLVEYLEFAAKAAGVLFGEGPDPAADLDGYLAWVRQARADLQLLAAEVGRRLHPGEFGEPEKPVTGGAG